MAGSRVLFVPRKMSGVLRMACIVLYRTSLQKNSPAFDDQISCPRDWSSSGIIRLPRSAVMGSRNGAPGMAGNLVLIFEPNAFSPVVSSLRPFAPFSRPMCTTASKSCAPPLSKTSAGRVAPVSLTGSSSEEKQTSKSGTFSTSLGIHFLSRWLATSPTVAHRGNRGGGHS